MTTIELRSCYCHVRTPSDRDDMSCFFYGASCSGLRPVDLHSDWSNCVISKFNFVNNTDSNGYFRLVHQNIRTKIKESVISFTSTSPKWINSAASNSYMEIVDSFVVTSGDLAPHAQVATVNVHKTVCASTHRQFPKYPAYKECGPISLRFSHSIPPPVPCQYMPVTLAFAIVNFK